MFQDAKIGILGGGQLGGMLIQQAISYGLNISVMDSSPDSSCARYTTSFHLGDTLSYDDVVAFGKSLDVITIEKEAVNVQALKHLQELGVAVYPSPDIISTIQDKYLQKEFLQSHDIPVVPGIRTTDRADIYNYAGKLPVCLKKCRNGYDGTGVMMLRSEADIARAFDEPCVMEDIVDIAHEISVIVARNVSGETKCYDPVLMMFDQERFVLDYQLCPAQLSEERDAEARAIATKIAEACGLVGILAVEMFITADGRLLVNELAPRPHNSGHHTIEACGTSQYDQLIRAVLGLPLGETRIHLSSAMVNILQPPAARQENMEQAFTKLLGMPGVHMHWYGKKGNREGRKIGHITVTDTTIEEALSKAKTIRNLLN